MRARVLLIMAASSSASPITRRYLPGIGPYTAAAVAIAGSAVETVLLDGNKSGHGAAIRRGTLLPRADEAIKAR
jgi:hypothetical protein